MASVSDHRPSVSASLYSRLLASEAALPSRGRVGVSALLRNFARTGVAPLFTGDVELLSM